MAQVKAGGWLREVVELVERLFAGGPFCPRCRSDEATWIDGTNDVRSVWPLQADRYRCRDCGHHWDEYSLALPDPT
jgi:transposase-like protein